MNEGKNVHPCDNLLTNLTSVTSKRLKQASMLTSWFEALGLSIINRKDAGSSNTFEQHWQSYFGVTSRICKDVWMMLEPNTFPASVKLE